MTVYEVSGVEIEKPWQQDRWRFVGKRFYVDDLDIQNTNVYKCVDEDIELKFNVYEGSLLSDWFWVKTLDGITYTFHRC